MRSFFKNPDILDFNLRLSFILVFVIVCTLYDVINRLENLNKQIEYLHIITGNLK